VLSYEAGGMCDELGMCGFRRRPQGMQTLYRAIILANNGGGCCGVVQAVSCEPDHGGPSLLPGFFFAGDLMGGVHVGVSSVTSGFPCHRSTSST